MSDNNVVKKVVIEEAAKQGAKDAKNGKYSPPSSPSLLDRAFGVVDGVIGSGSEGERNDLKDAARDAYDKSYGANKRK